MSGVQFKKGPYFADEGDFSAAGAANINYVNQLEGPIIRVSTGNNGWGRLFGAASPRIGGGYLLGALEVNHNDGPWVRPDNYRKVNGVVRYSRGDNRSGFSLTGMGYWADWIRPTRFQNGRSTDIDYFYPSRLPGEPAGGVEDVHTHPALPRSARIGIQFSFLSGINGVRLTKTPAGVGAGMRPNQR